MYIREDDLTDPRVVALVQRHLEDMHNISPKGSVHALDISSLKVPGVTFWTLWDSEQAAELFACGALQEIEPQHGEIKSMRTSDTQRRKGIASRMVTHIVSEACRRNYTNLSLETGSTAHFAAARALYAKHGFEPCGPFGGYSNDPHSFFMTKSLASTTNGTRE